MRTFIILRCASARWSVIFMVVAPLVVEFHERVVERDVVAAVSRRAIDGEDDGVELMQEVRQDVRVRLCHDVRVVLERAAAERAEDEDVRAIRRRDGEQMTRPLLVER